MDGDSAAYKRARQLRLAGATVSSIARETGISRRTPVRHFRQAGIPLPSENPPTPPNSQP